MPDGRVRFFTPDERLRVFCDVKVVKNTRFKAFNVLKRLVPPYSLRKKTQIYNPKFHTNL